MRVLGTLGFLALIVIVIGLLLWLARRGDRTSANKAVRRAKWEATNVTEGNQTVVLVRRVIVGAEGQDDVIERREIARINNDASDYDDRISQAMDTAHQRAVRLNSLAPTKR